jgi:hypothetical protein
MKPALPTWKPTHCANCPAKHPSWSRTGKRGPWLCHACYKAGEAQ